MLKILKKIIFFIFLYSLYKNIFFQHSVIIKSTNRSRNFLHANIQRLKF